MPISIGTTTVTALFLGTTSISSAYLGNTLVFGGSFTPLSLFSSGAQGIWLDPSDLSTMFSDRAGTIQVTTPGTVVGKRLDKSGRGNHAVAPTDAARPIYGVEPKGGRRNLLTWSEDFGNAAWTKDGSTVAVASDPQEWYLANNGVATQSILSQAINPSGNAIFAVDLKADTIRYVRLRFLNVTNTNIVDLDLQTGASNGLPVTDVGGGFYRVYLALTSGADNNGIISIYLSDTSGGGTVSASAAKRIIMRKSQFELGSTSTNYQRVTTAYDVTESGVATTHYVQYDGSDDSMSTSSIDFTGTDKMSVFAGVRKLSDNASIMLEFSAVASSNNGSFFLAHNGTGAPTGYNAVSRGSAAAVEMGANGYLAPRSDILGLTGDIAGDRATLRVNGTQVAQATGDQGTGNYGNYPLFIGRRNNASLPFNGKDYGIIIVGKAASAGEITDTETWLAAKTSGVTL